MAADEQVLTARWVFPGSGAPLERGTITVRSGQIAAVEPLGQRTADLDLGNAAIIPGLVNAHTHLDLSGLRGQVPPSADFVGWLRAVIAHRRASSIDDVQAAIRSGLEQSLAFGTTLVGDVASGGSSWGQLVAAPIRSLCFRELLGLRSDRVKAVWAELVAWMNAHPDTPTCRAGVSPHAPYSVHRTLIEASARLWPTCIHLAESEPERELLESKSGPFVPFLNELGVWDPDGLAPSWEWLVWKMARGPGVLFAHANHLTAVDRPANATIVYCPRTHAVFGHPPHPFREFLARGTRVALGTDSLASNPDLDVLAEARFVRTHYPDVPGEVLLRMATQFGADALGFGRETGSLEPGKSVDLVAIELANVDREPHELLLEEALGTRRTMFRGEWRGR